ncbi:hypothetical protein GCM10009737_31040 [Nocardioides lentus]|uniref:Uncharacterized protein n=1 Tax=Nocardioides lentus TaxID=338077 RepID=A0ABP5B0Y3_9ACTN
MGIDWESELDSAIERPRDRPGSDYLAPGRRALRARRLAVGAGAAVVVAALGGGLAVAGATGLPGTDRGAGPDVARDPGTDRSTDRAGATEREPDCADVRLLGEPAVLGPSGRLCLAPGVEVLRRVANPMEYPGDVGRSVGLEVEVDGTREFVLALTDQDGTSVTSRPATGSLELWLPAVVAVQRTLDEADGTPVAGTPPPPDSWVEIDADGDLVAAADAVRLVAQRPADLGAAFAAPGETSLVAELRVDGERMYVAVRRSDGETQVVPGGGGFADLDAFVEDARERYSSGEGLL